LVVFGTRPEAIKLAPVIRAARRHADWNVRVCCTRQHMQLLPPILNALEIGADIELTCMRSGQSLDALMANLLSEIDPVLARERPGFVIGQGDTATAFASALSAFHHGIGFAHVEAGLRTHDLSAPFPEEAYRQLIARVAAVHLTPTRRADAALFREGIDAASIVRTGNTVVDAVQWARAKLERTGDVPESVRKVGSFARFVLITGHRRESFDGGLRCVCGALGKLAAAHPDVGFVYPVHLNPNVQAAVNEYLQSRPNLLLLPPVDYLAAIWLLDRAQFVITDSGGIQEEAPEFGKRVLVTRVATERMEAVERGSAELVGYDGERLFARAHAWLKDPDPLRSDAGNPFGDGRAGERCVAAIRQRMGLPWAPVPAWEGG
jgi:UDP-N-acetylglucosamine 2-epimerase